MRDDAQPEDRPRMARVVKVKPAKRLRPISDDNQDGSKPRISRTPRWVLPVVLSVAGLCLLACVVLVVGVEMARKANPEWAAEMDRQVAERQKQIAADASDAERLTKVYPRGEFNTLVVGKTADGVLKAVGKPSSTSEIGQFSYWRYSFRTKDTVSGNNDWSATVVFKNGISQSVTY